MTRADEQYVSELLADRDTARREWARRFLPPRRDYSRLIVVLGVIIGVLLCASIAGYVYTTVQVRENQQEVQCRLAETKELIVAYVEARQREAKATGPGVPPSPVPDPPSGIILRQFTKNAKELRASAGHTCRKLDLPPALEHSP